VPENREEAGDRRKREWMYKQAMRNGQNKRMRGRNRKGQNPLTRIYESNGPDVKIRGTASHVAEKYIQLARDAQASGDPVAAENYYQHAEHYFRLIATAQEQFRQSQPYFRPEGEPREDSLEDAEEEHPGDSPFGREPQSQPYPPRDAQPYQHPREPQHYPGREPQPYQPREQQPYGGRPPAGAGRPEQGDGDRLPSFITGNGPQPPQPSYPGHGQNGFDGQPDRFPLHRRRRRRHGPRGDMPGSPQQQASSGAAEEPGPPPGPSGGPTTNE
jgi:Domain of unknown function (DUF4167)